MREYGCRAEDCLTTYGAFYTADLAANLSPRAGIWVAIDPDRAWSPDQLLLASIADVLAWANWQRAGDKRAKKPQPINRPGVKGRGETITDAPDESFATISDWLAFEAKFAQVGDVESDGGQGQTVQATD